MSFLKRLFGIKDQPVDYERGNPPRVSPVLKINRKKWSKVIEDQKSKQNVECSCCSHHKKPSGS